MSFDVPLDTSDNSVLGGIHVSDLIRGLKQFQQSATPTSDFQDSFALARGRSVSIGH
jgi:hypothetical protein